MSGTQGGTASRGAVVQLPPEADGGKHVPGNHAVGVGQRAPAPPVFNMIWCWVFTFVLSSSFRMDGVHVPFLCLDTKSVFQVLVRSLK